MEVDPAKALKSTYEGKDFYFCCETCKTTFDKEPEKFAKKDEEKPGGCCCGG